MTTIHRSLLLATLVVPLALVSGDSHADGISINLGGAVHVGADVHVHVNTDIEVEAEVDFGWGVGVRFAEPPPPPPPPPCGHCEGPVPSYHVAHTVPQTVYVEPVYVEPIHVQIDHRPTTPRHRKRSRWGLGAFAGTMSPDGMAGGTDLGLMAQYRFTRRLAVEAELAKSKVADGDRVDKRLGAALLYDLTGGRRLVPFLLAGAGYGQTEIGGSEFHAEQGYGEVGAGLRLNLGHSLQVIADLRAGERTTRDDYVYMSTGTGSAVSVEENEGYSRLRVGAMLRF